MAKQSASYTHSRIPQHVKEWESTGLLAGFKDHETPVALCLTAQLKRNEQSESPAQFKRLSIPLVVRVFAESNAFRRNHFTNEFNGDRPSVVMFRTRFQPTSGDLQEEADYCATFAESVRKELDALFSDTKNAIINFHGFDMLADGTVVFLYS